MPRSSIASVIFLFVGADDEDTVVCFMPAAGAVIMAVIVVLIHHHILRLHRMRCHKRFDLSHK